MRSKLFLLDMLFQSPGALARLKFPLAVWLVSALGTHAWGILNWYWSIGMARHETIRHYYYGVEPIVTSWQAWIYGIWQRWDAIHYQRIAQDGYIYEALGAFFPLYPFMGRLFSTLMQTHVLAGLLLASNLAFAGTLIMLYAYTSKFFSPNLARFSTIFAALYPHSLLSQR